MPINNYIECKWIFPIKRHRGTEWIKNKTQLYVAYLRLTSSIKKDRVKVKKWEKLSRPYLSLNPHITPTCTLGIARDVNCFSTE
jgi:hypothetical protein